MATESLIVELDAKTDDFDRKIKNTDGNLDSLNDTTQKSNSRLADFASAAKTAAVGVTAVAAAIGVAINQAADFAKEVKVAAQRTGDSVEKMQALAFATDTVGVSLEKLGDIGKDTNEKIGEFIATGGGGFQDFADVLGLTEQQAQDTAAEFEKMSGTDVLQAMVTQMEQAGVSGERMSFALEGMASDTTDLIPLLVNGGEKMKGLTEQFNGLGAAIDSTDLNKIEEVGQKLDQATAVFSAEGKKLIAEYSEELITGIDTVLLFAQKSAATFNVVTTGLGNLLSIAQAGFTDFVNDTDTLDAVIAERAKLSQAAIDGLLGGDPEQSGRESGAKFANGFATGMSGGGGSTGKGGESDKGEGDNKRKLPNGLTEDEMIETIEIQLDLMKELNFNILDEEEKLQSDILKIKKKANRDELKEDRKLAKDKAKNEKFVADSKQAAIDLISKKSKTAAKILFEATKAKDLAEAITGTAKGIAQAMPNYPLAIAAGITGAAQIAAIASTSFEGGGSAPVVSGGGSISAPEQSEPEAETSSLEVSEAGTGGAQTFQLVLEDGTQLAEGLMGVIDENQRQGR